MTEKLQELADWLGSRSTLEKRTALAIAIILDSSFGLLHGKSLLNGVDFLLGGGLPNLSLIHI